MLIAQQALWHTKTVSDIFEILKSRERGLTKEENYQHETLLNSIFKGYFETDFTKTWTISLTTLAVFQWFNAWNCRSESKSIFQMNPFSNKFLVGATMIVIFLQLFAVYNSFMQKFLHTTSLGFSEWFTIILIAGSIILVEEIRKFFMRLSL